MNRLGKKAAAIGFLAFLILLAAGTVRGFTLPSPPPLASYLPVSRETASRLGNWNNLKQIGLAKMPLPLVLDQGDVERIRVFEKSAQLATVTTEFDEDQGRIRSALAAHTAVVFDEKDAGLTPERRLALEIGIHPDKFDALVKQLRGIGQLQSASVEQRDRTGEFRRLHAQRQSLKTYLESVLKLRGAKNPSINDSLKLEQRIQDVEKDLQTLSVQLGDLLGKESYYHIHVTLAEQFPGSGLTSQDSVPRLLAHACLWALGWWFVFALAGGLLVATWLSVQILRGKTLIPGPQQAPLAPPT